MLLCLYGIVLQACLLKRLKQGSETSETSSSSASDSNTFYEDDDFSSSDDSSEEEGMHVMSFLCLSVFLHGLKINRGLYLDKLNVSDDECTRV